MNKVMLLYIVSAMSLIALAGVYPKLATWIVGLLILGVVATHAKDYTALLQAAQGLPQTGYKEKTF